MPTSDDTSAHCTESIALMLDAVETAYRAQGFSPDRCRELAADAILAIGTVVGGRRFYVPNGTYLRAALRRAQMYREWRAGSTVAELARAHGIAERSVRRSIQDERKRRTGFAPTAVG